MDHKAAPAPRRARGGGRTPRRGWVCSALVERQFRHRQARTVDFDACWDPTGVDVDALDPIFFDLSYGRASQKARFGGALFPNVVESGSGLDFADFFQNERDGSRKGIVVLLIGDPS